MTDGGLSGFIGPVEADALVGTNSLRQQPEIESTAGASSATNRARTRRDHAEKQLPNSGGASLRADDHLCRLVWLRCRVGRGRTLHVPVIGPRRTLLDESGTSIHLEIQANGRQTRVGCRRFQNQARRRKGPKLERQHPLSHRDGLPCPAWWTEMDGRRHRVSRRMVNARCAEANLPPPAADPAPLPHRRHRRSSARGRRARSGRHRRRRHRAGWISGTGHGGTGARRPSLGGLGRSQRC